MSLYQISNQYAQLLEMDDYGIEDLQALDQLDDDFKRKAISVGAYIKNCEAMIENIKNARKNMYERAQRLKSKVDMLRAYLKENMEKCKLYSISDHDMFEIKIKKNPPKLVVLEEKLIPKMYFKREVKDILSKTLIKQALEKNTPVPGAMILHDKRVEIK